MAMSRQDRAGIPKATDIKLKIITNENADLNRYATRIATRTIPRLMMAVVKGSFIIVLL